MQNKAFTLVEMLVALAVGAIVIMATYASYEMVDTQYKKNIDVANMHTSGRSIMQMIERDVRMAGFEYRHTSGTNKGKKAFSSSITTPLDITVSGNKCCDEVKVIYDYFNEETKVVKRIQIHYFTIKKDTPKKGKRYRLYKQVNDILPTAKTRPAEVMADFVEDLQFENIVKDSSLYYGSDYGLGMTIVDPVTRKNVGSIKGTRVGAIAFGPNGLLYYGSDYGLGMTIVDPVTRKNVGSIKGTRVGAIAFKNKRTGQESLVTISLTLRAKNPYGKDRQFKKKDYHAGNYKLDKTDKYKRDTFLTTVLVRNLAL